MKPRVHWVSPLPPAETDIAHYTRRIAQALADETDLVLWTDQDHWDPALSKIAPVHRLDPDRVTARDFATARPPTRAPEVVIVQMGNAWPFHSGLLRMARRVPCIVVFHDIAIQEMLNDALDRDLLNPDLYANEMVRWYGAEGAAATSAVRAGEIKPSSLGAEMPGFELWLDRAIGAITHTPAAAEALRARTALPVRELPLPFQPSDAPPSPARAASGPLLLVQFGYIGPNRRLDTVLDVLAELKTQIRFRFDIMGRVGPLDAMRHRIAQLGLAEQVHINGFVSEPNLDARLRQAHLAFNLRHPTMGEASGSQLRIWNAATAAVVTDQGWYHDLPDDTVFKIPVKGEAEALAALLLRLNADRQMPSQKGQAGNAFLNAHHSPKRYAAEISKYVSKCVVSEAVLDRARAQHPLSA